MANKGSILITTLWIMAILSLLAMGIGFRSSIEVRLGKFSMERLEARYLAKAGIVKALGLLPDDTNKYDTLYECGITVKEREETLEGIFGDKFNKLGAGSFSVHYTSIIEAEEVREEAKKTEKGRRIQKIYSMLDEERKININMSKLTPDGKGSYIKILNNLLPEPEPEEGEEEFTKPDIINAILDWQDKDSVGNAENNYYEGLGHPYKCKNKDFELTEELLLVKGINRKYFEKIKDFITVYGDGKLNANTASREALQAIIVHPEFVDRVVEHRKGADGEEGTNDDRFWEDANSFLRFLQSVGMKDTSPISKYFTVTSNYFRIQSCGSVGRVKSTLICVVKRETASKEEEKTGQIFEYYHEE